MPRQPRIDAPGMVHHVMARGIEKSRIFVDDEDRNFFLKRLGDLVVETGNPVYAFALIPNHFHLLVRRGKTPLATLMRRLLTGYALYVNKKRGRCGHLFQGRYKSIPCGDEIYFAEVLRYINLNPVRAGRCSFPELANYRYSGHGCIMGNRKISWLDSEAVLSLFSKSPKQARNLYAAFVAEGLDGADEDECAAPAKGACRDKQNAFHDANLLTIFGSGSCLIHEKKHVNMGETVDVQKLFRETCLRHDVTKIELLGKTRTRRIANARRYLAKRMSMQSGLTRSQIATLLSVQPAAVTKMLSRKEKNQEL